MRVECVNLVDPSQHHCVSVFILARRCRPVRRGVFVIINVLFFFPPPGQQVPAGGGGRDEEMSGGWERDTFRETDACLQNSADQIRPENVLLCTDKFSCFESCQVVDDGGSTTRTVFRIRIIIIRYRSAESCCRRRVSVYLLRAITQNGLVIRRQVPIQYAIGPGSIGRSADKPENGVEKFLGVKSLRFYVHITIILWRTTRGPFRNCTPAFRYSLLGTVVVHRESVAVWDTSRVQAIRT